MKQCTQLHGVSGGTAADEYIRPMSIKFYFRQKTSIVHG